MVGDQRALMECFRRLGSAEFLPLREWLADERATMVDRLVAAQDDRELHQAQGAARFLKRLDSQLDAAAKSRGGF